MACHRLFGLLQGRLELLVRRIDEVAQHVDGARAFPGRGHLDAWHDLEARGCGRRGLIQPREDVVVRYCDRRKIAFRRGAHRLSRRQAPVRSGRVDMKVNQITPLVEGISPARRGSGRVASSRARARALKVASARW